MPGKETETKYIFLIKKSQYQTPSSRWLGGWNRIGDTGKSVTIEKCPVVHPKHRACFGLGLQP